MISRFPDRATADPGHPLETVGDEDLTKVRIVATGGIFGAIAASTCCIVPLVLFSLGIWGAWVGNLTALEPFKPIFIAFTVAFLGYGYWLVYRKSKSCEADLTCARPMPNRLVNTALWGSTVLVLIAFFWNWIAPIVAPVMLGL